MQIPFYSLKYTHHSIKHELLKVTQDIIESNQFIFGEDLENFESAFASFCGVDNCIGTGNGFDALKIALISLGIGKGDEVIVPAHTFIATWLAVSSVGAIPIPVDALSKTMNINPALISAKITSKTKAIIPVHIYGQICEMDEIVKLAKRNNIFIIEDFAQAQGASYNGKMAGSFGDINATSFYPGKNLGALGDGGAVVTANLKYAITARQLTNYGSKVKYIHEIKGVNTRLDNLQAAFLNIKLKHLKDINEERGKIANWYNQAFKNNKHIALQDQNVNSKSVYHLYVVRVRNREMLKEYLLKKGIATQIHYPIAIFKQKAYRDLNLKSEDYPVADAIANTCLSLPLYPGLKKEEVDYITRSVLSFYEE